VHGLQPHIHGFNTALFIDLENLIGGYANGVAATINLAGIMSQVVEADRTVGAITGVAIKRAYANWAITSLGKVRPQMVQLGIEPVQVFSFDTQGVKNAADIELAIDAVDVAHTRPAISTFVIVTGDGGFGSVVRKLHELGRFVVIAGSRQKASRSLLSVCDVFVDIQPVSATPAAKREVRAPVATAAAAPKPVDRTEPGAPTESEDRIAAAAAGLEATLTSEPTASPAAAGLRAHAVIKQLFDLDSVDQDAQVDLATASRLVRASIDQFDVTRWGSRSSSSSCASHSALKSWSWSRSTAIRW
jgi:uncharacterized LabA/DUF88 family protein